MKKLGKNKKKQWRYCCKDLDGTIEASRKQQEISEGGFTVNLPNKNNLRLIRGDKDAAKDFPEIQLLPISVLRPRRYHPIKPNKEPIVDIWQDEAKSVSKRESKQPPLAPHSGQSYNPTAIAHYTLLSSLGALELCRRKREAKTERFLRPLGTHSKPLDPLSEARAFLQTLSNVTETQTASFEQVLDSPIVGARRPTRLRQKKKNNMAVELENIPKLLKEIRRENRLKSLRKAHSDARRDRQRKLRKMNSIIPFQMPAELVTSLRKLIPEVDLIREVEENRNTCPRARRTLGITKHTKTYERRQ